MEEPASAGAQARTATRQDAEYSEADCDGSEDCPVSSSIVDWGPGRPQAHAWRTSDGGYCVEWNACGRGVFLCPY